MKLKLRNCQDASHDGATWNLEPVLLVDDEGKVTTDDDPGWTERLVALKVLPNKYTHMIVYYNDNPAVYGVPDPTVTVGKTTFDVSDLVDTAGWGDEAGEVWAEL